MPCPPARLQGLISIDRAVPDRAEEPRDEDTCLADTLRRLSGGPHAGRFSRPGHPMSAVACRQGRTAHDRWYAIGPSPLRRSCDTSWLAADVPALMRQLQQQADDVLRRMLV